MRTRAGGTSLPPQTRRPLMVPYCDWAASVMLIEPRDKFAAAVTRAPVAMRIRLKTANRPVKEDSSHHSPRSREKPQATSGTKAPGEVARAGSAVQSRQYEYYSARSRDGSIFRSLTTVSLALITVSSPEGAVIKPFLSTASCQTTSF